MFTNSASKVADAFDSIELMANDLLRFEEFILKKIEEIEMMDQ